PAAPVSPIVIPSLTFPRREPPGYDVQCRLGSFARKPLRKNLPNRLGRLRIAARFRARRLPLLICGDAPSSPEPRLAETRATRLACLDKHCVARPRDIARRLARLDPPYGALHRSCRARRNVFCPGRLLDRRRFLGFRLRKKKARPFPLCLGKTPERVSRQSGP